MQLVLSSGFFLSAMENIAMVSHMVLIFFWERWRYKSKAKSCSTKQKSYFGRGERRNAEDAALEAGRESNSQILVWSPGCMCKWMETPAHLPLNSNSWNLREWVGEREKWTCSIYQCRERNEVPKRKSPSRLKREKSYGLVFIWNMCFHFPPPIWLSDISSFVL